MVSSLYDHSRNHFAEGDVHWKIGGDDFKALLVSGDLYVPDLANDEYLSAVMPAARVSEAVISNPVATAGVCDADDVTFLSVSGVVCHYLIIYQDNGNNNLSVLIAVISDAVGLPVTPNGNNILVQWDNGSNKIFVL